MPTPSISLPALTTDPDHVEGKISTSTSCDGASFLQNRTHPAHRIRLPTSTSADSVDSNATVRPRIPSSYSDETIQPRKSDKGLGHLLDARRQEVSTRGPSIDPPVEGETPHRLWSWFAGKLRFMLKGGLVYQPTPNIAEDDSRDSLYEYPSVNPPAWHKRFHFAFFGSHQYDYPGAVALPASSSNISSLIPLSSHTPKSKLAWLKYIFGGYCLVSLALFSSTLYNDAVDSEGFLGLARVTSPASALGQTRDVRHSSHNLSLLNEMSPSLRLSRLSRIDPAPEAFFPGVISSVEIANASVNNVAPSDTKPTACIWADDRDLYLVPRWASIYNGPISLLLTTREHPSLENLRILLEHLSHNLPLLDVHVLHLGARASQASPNTFLNLARMFARGEDVLLLPEAMTAMPPQLGESDALIEDTLSHDEGLAPTPKSPDIGRIFEGAGRNRRLLKMKRDDPIWCSERFGLPDDPHSEREGAWRECVWGMHVNSAGRLGWTEMTEPKGRKIQRRLREAQRAEVCVLATRQRESHPDDDRDKMWVNNFCRVRLEKWEKELH